MFFMASLLSYVWRAHLTGVDTFVPLTPRQALGPRIAISAIFVLGLVCLVLVIRTLATNTRRRRANYPLERNERCWRAGSSTGRVDWSIVGLEKRIYIQKSLRFNTRVTVCGHSLHRRGANNTAPFFYCNPTPCTTFKAFLHLCLRPCRCCSIQVASSKKNIVHIQYILSAVVCFRRLCPSPTESPGH
jgi:hypothetical protein